MREIYAFLRKCGFAPLLFGAIISAKTLGYDLGPIDLLAYAASVWFALLLLVHGLKFDSLSLLFVLYLPLTILIDDPKPIFRPWPRYLSFLLVFICAAPLLKSIYAVRFRNKVLMVMVGLCILISSISFICYFLGINMMMINMSTRYPQGYMYFHDITFSGITNHSMLLGPISGIGLIASSYIAIVKKKKIAWLFVVMCSGALLFSASRAALAATIAGEILFLMNSARKKSKNFLRIGRLLVLVIATYPLWGGALDGINNKNKGDIQQGINLDSRQRKWDIRIEEWKESPVTGIGFVSVSDRDTYTREGIIEPGSSWLGILSMTGIIGFALFAGIYFRAMRRSLMTHSTKGAMIGGLLVLIGVHMLAEGHILSGGSYLCFISWLIIGCATDTPSKMIYQ